MANMCSNTIAFYSKDKEELNALHKKADNYQRCTPADHGRYSLDGFIDFCSDGMVKSSHPRNEFYYCGDIHETKEYFYFMITTGTTWIPDVSMIKELLDKCYAGIDFEYLSCEDGCEIYVKSDVNGVFFPEKYKLCLVTSSDDNGIEDEATFPSEKELAHYLKSFFGVDTTEGMTVDEIREEAKKDLEYVEIYDFKIV